MDTYFRCTDFDLWYIVTKCLFKITKIVDGREVEKDVEELSEEITGGMEIVFVSSMKEVVNEALKS